MTAGGRWPPRLGLGALEALLYPPRCLLCHAPGQQTPSGLVDLCADCEADFVRNARPFTQPCVRCAQAMDIGTDQALCGRCLVDPPPFDWAISLYVYAFPLDGLIKALKYQGKRVAWRVLQHLLVQQLAQWGQPEYAADALLAVPLHRKRLMRRGFNQAQTIAACLAAAWSLPLLDKAVARVRETDSQSRLSLSERRRNVRGAFRLNPEQDWTGRHPVLVDDVLTSGSTVAELTRLLKRAGAAEVGVVSLARAVSPRASGAK